MSMTITWTLGEVIAKVRKDAHLEQAELAERASIARNTLSNYETGRSVPPFDVAVRLAAACGVPLELFAEAVNAKAAPSEDEAAGERARRDSNPQPSDQFTVELAFWQIVSQVEAVAS